MSTYNCINCGFNGTDRESLRIHPCLTSSDKWKERAQIRLEARESMAERRRDDREESIKEIIGDVSPAIFYQLRYLFAEWEEAESAMSEATERLNSL
jgi:hypothetical protein